MERREVWLGAKCREGMHGPHPLLWLKSDVRDVGKTNRATRVREKISEPQDAITQSCEGARDTILLVSCFLLDWPTKCLHFFRAITAHSRALISNALLSSHLHTPGVSIPYFLGHILILMLFCSSS